MKNLKQQLCTDVEHTVEGNLDNFSRTNTWNTVWNNVRNKVWMNVRNNIELLVYITLRKNT